MRRSEFRCGLYLNSGLRLKGKGRLLYVLEKVACRCVTGGVRERYGEQLRLQSPRSSKRQEKKRQRVTYHKVLDLRLDTSVADSASFCCMASQAWAVEMCAA